MFTNPRPDDQRLASPGLGQPLDCRWLGLGKAVISDGIPVHAHVIEDPDAGDIGLAPGLMVSSIVTAIAIGFTLLALWRSEVI